MTALKRISRICSVVAVALLATLSAVLPSLAQQNEAPKVTIAAAYSEELIRDATFVGRGEASDKTELVAQVSGIVTEVSVPSGAAVKAGDIILRIEPDTYRADVAARTAQLQRAEANLELARIDLERKTELLRREAIPQSEFDIAEANAAIAEADINSASAALQEAELNLERTEIKAPFDGRIGRTKVSPGALVGPSTGPLATLVRTRPIYVTFSLSEPQLLRVLALLETGMADLVESGRSPKVFVQLPDGTRLEEAGTVVFLDNRINPATGTISLRAEFANSRKMILDGSFVTVIIEALEPTLSVLVPQSAIQRDQRGPFVLVVTDQQRVEQRYIQLGPEEGTAIVVSDGLREGESVIVEGLQRVRPGVEVNAVLSGTGAGD